MSTEKDRKQFPFYSEQEMNDNEATRNYCKNTVFVDETGNDEAMVYNMRAMAFMAGIQHARQGEMELLKKFALYRRRFLLNMVNGECFIDARAEDEHIIDEFLEQEKSK